MKVVTHVDIELVKEDIEAKNKAYLAGELALKRRQEICTHEEQTLYSSDTAVVDNVYALKCLICKKFTRIDCDLYYSLKELKDD